MAKRWAHQPIFGVKRKAWRKDDEHSAVADKEFEQIRQNVLARDKFTCRFCAFKAQKYQEVHHVDDDHANNKPDNLLTVCSLCHQVHHLGMAGMRNAGFMAAIPELTQVEVNHVARAYFIHKALAAENDASHGRMVGLYALFQERGDAMKSAFNLDITQPMLFAQILSSADDALYAERGKLFESIRLVPSEGAFSAEQMTHYRESQATIFTDRSFTAMAGQLVAQ